MDLLRSSHDMPIALTRITPSKVSAFLTTLAVGFAIVMIPGMLAYGIAALVVAGSSGLLWRFTARRYGIRFADLTLFSLPIRIASAYVLYTLPRGGDADAYFSSARAFATHAPGAFPHNSIPGTGIIDRAAGYLYISGLTNQFAMDIAFATIGWVGLVLMASAALEWIDPRLFSNRAPKTARLLVAAMILLPSTVLWPSSIGKDAWMALALGLSMRGIVARIRGKGGFGQTAAGFVLGLAVRPQVELLLLISVLAGSLIARRPLISRLNRNSWVAVVGLPLVGILVITPVVARYTNTGFSSDQAVATLRSAASLSAYGGSVFQPTSVFTLKGLVIVPLTVYARPFPFEAHNVMSLLASVEALAVGGMTLWFLLSRLSKVLTTLRQDYVAAICLVYVLGFAVMFSTVSDFGALARERVQALPFLLVFLALLTRRDGRDPPEVERPLLLTGTGLSSTSLRGRTSGTGDDE